MLDLEPTSACVLLFHPTSALVLIEDHPDGIGLPGGRREPFDRTALSTGKRELFEETGVELYSARSILVYQAGPHVCQAFLAVEHGPIPGEEELRERKAGWASSTVLVGAAARFPHYCSLMYAAMAAKERARWELIRCR